MRSAPKFWILFAISAVMFFTPISSAESVGLGADKVIHFFLFASLAVFGYRAYAHRRFYLFPSLFFYTLVSEYIQGRYVPFRSFDGYDIVADSLGLLGGIIFLTISSSEKKANNQ